MKEFQKIIQNLEKTMLYLYWRWQDEYKYEDITDYEEFLCSIKDFDDVTINTKTFKIKIKKGGYIAIIEFDDEKSQMTYSFYG